jgi:hypothetical protein
MSSKGPRRTECDHRSRDSATVLDSDAKFGKREARKKLWARLLRLDPHVHPYCHLYSQLRELHAADWFSTRVQKLTPYRLIDNMA